MTNEYQEIIDQVNREMELERREKAIADKEKSIAKELTAEAQKQAEYNETRKLRKAFGLE